MALAFLFSEPAVQAGGLEGGDGEVSVWGAEYDDIAISEEKLDPQTRRILREILRAVRSVKHGQVTIIVQDSRVIQIDRTEKMRLV